MVTLFISAGPPFCSVTYFEVGFRLQHECRINDLSKRYPSAVIAWWCNHERDLMEIFYDGVPDPEAFVRSLGDTLSAIGGRQTLKNVTHSSIQIVTNCTCQACPSSTSLTLQKHNCLVIYPAINTEGWEWYRTIVLSQKDMKGLFRDMERMDRFEIVSKRMVEKGSVSDTFVVSTTSLTGGLTENQSVALLVALNSGYYSVPRKVRTLEIAEKLGMKRTTFEEHLRKAESKVLKSVAPYLQISVGMRSQESDERNSNTPGAGFPTRLSEGRKSNLVDLSIRSMPRLNRPQAHRVEQGLKGQL